MPAVTCPYCYTPTALPDPWPHPGFTCPNCRATVAMAVPPASPPPPAPDPFDVSEEPTRSRRRFRRDHPEGAHPGLILGGYVCALLSLLIFPPALGLSGLVFGAFCISQKSTLNGMLIVVLSLVCATVGMIWGVEVAFWGRPRFLLN